LTQIDNSTSVPLPREPLNLSLNRLVNEMLVLRVFASNRGWLLRLLALRHPWLKMNALRDLRLAEVG